MVVVLAKMVNISISVVIQVSTLQYGYIYKFHGFITHKNDEYISVSCNSSFFSAIWLHANFMVALLTKMVNISVSCNVSFYSAIWLHVQTSWLALLKKMMSISLSVVI